jgi:peptidoglycan/LPS O-acetylase OafA/YrhL
MYAGEKSNGVHNRSFTSLRGLAALWVMFFHIDVSLFNRGYGHLIDTPLLQKGYLLVDLFFILSGYVIAMSATDKLISSLRLVGAFFIKRIGRVYPLHLFTLGLTITLYLGLPNFLPSVLNDNWHSNFSTAALFQNLFLLNAHGLHNSLSWNIASWSIGAEMTAYILFPIIAISISNISSQVTRSSVLLIMSATLYFGLFSLVSSQSLDHTFNFGFIRGLAGFILGLALFSSKHCFTLEISTTCAMRVASWLGIILSMYLSWSDYLIIPFFAMLIYSYANHEVGSSILQGKALIYLGKISFSIYLVHSVVLGYFWFLQPEIAPLSAHPSTLELIGYSATFVVITLITSHFTYRYVELTGIHLASEGLQFQKRCEKQLPMHK